MSRFFIAILALAISVYAPALGTDLGYWHKSIDLAEPNAPQEVSISCGWGKTLVMGAIKEGPGAILTCDENGSGIRIYTNIQ